MAAPLSIPGRRPLYERRTATGPWLHIDVLLLLTTLALAATGLLMVYSATRGSDPTAYDTSFLERQGIFVMVGVALMIGIAFLPYEELRGWAPFLYFVGLLATAAVLSPLGVEVNGARAWFSLAGFQLQPSEFLKIGYVVALASYLSRFDGDLRAGELARALAIGAPALVLIMLQPDVGTALVFIAITMGMLLIGGARLKHIVFLTVTGAIGVVAVWNAGVLREYQQARLLSFLDPDAAGAAADAAYQQTQAQIAIGSGGFGGQGWGNGGQTRGEFVPEQHTDFIFTVVGEELGFIGAAAVLGLFALLVWRAMRTAHRSADTFGSLLCVGVVTMIVFQMFQAVGMTMGIMPITGIPVPFLSYGGSSALTSFTAMGIVLSVHIRRFQAMH